VSGLSSGLRKAVGLFIFRRGFCVVVAGTTVSGD